LVNRDNYLQRLGELELERSDLAERIGMLKNQLAQLDKEYSAIRSILSSSTSDGRWASQSTPLLDIVYHTLKDAGRPLHYKEILNSLQSESFHIAGTASIQNLIVRLNRDSRFIKTDRGIWGLSEWVKIGDKFSKPVKYENEIEAPSNSEGDLTISERERGLEKTKFILQSVDIDIQITQNNIKALRDKLLGRKSDYKLPDNIDPQVASISFEKKLIRLLEQKNQLNGRLRELGSWNKRKELGSAINE
jgi:DNA-directed RNA polymerase delta subunit